MSHWRCRRCGHCGHCGECTCVHVNTEDTLRVVALVPLALARGARKLARLAAERAIQRFARSRRRP